MRQIDLSPGATADLEALRRTNPKAAATIAVILQEAKADPDIIERLTTPGNVDLGSHRLNVKGWVSARDRGDNLLRFRALESPATSYRVIYGYDWRTRHIRILAVVKKDDKTYKISDEVGRRILGDWRAATGGAST